MVNVFQMMKAPTNSAMPAKISSRIVRKFSESWILAENSAASAEPVIASAPAGSTVRIRAASWVWLTLASALTTICSNVPGRPISRCAVAVSK